MGEGTPLMAIAVPAAVFALIWPPVGLLLLLVGSLVVSASIGTGTGTELNFPSLFLLCLLLLWVCRLPWRGSIGRFLAPPFPPLAAFMVVAGASALLANSAHWRFALALYDQAWFAVASPAPLTTQLGQLGIFALSVGTFVLVADQVRSRGWLRMLTWAFLAVGATCMAAWVVPEFKRPTQDLFPPGMDGSLFWTWLVAIGFTQAAFNDRLPWGVRLALAVLTLATLRVAAFENREWASGWVPAFVAVAAGAWLGAPRIAAVASVAGAVLLIPSAARVFSWVMTFDNQYSLKTRLAAWQVLAHIVPANPVIGLGPANYYQYAIHLPILGWNVHFSSHNAYVDIIAQTGLVGLACLVWFTWQVARIGWTLRWRETDGFGRAYVLGALAGLAGTLAAGMLGDWFLPFVYNTGVAGFRSSLLGWFFLGGLVALKRIGEEEPASTTPPSDRE